MPFRKKHNLEKFVVHRAVNEYRKVLDNRKNG